jgi:hypothetical protein
MSTGRFFEEPATHDLEGNGMMQGTASATEKRNLGGHNSESKTYN